MNIKELAQIFAEKEFKKEDMNSNDWYAYEFYIKGFLKGHEVSNIEVPPLPFGEGNKVEKY
jgi:hypothetical protein